MRNFVSALASSALLVFGLAAAHAQNQPGANNPTQNQNDSQNPSGTLDRIRTDLDQVIAETKPFTSERDQLARASERISDLQGKLEGGMRDPSDINDAIRTMQQVVNSNGLSDGARDTLVNDLTLMRNFRSHHHL